MRGRIRTNLRQIISASLVAFGVLYLIVQVRFAPIVDEIATMTVENKAAGAINDAIDLAIASGELDYDKLITLEKDSNGNVTALKTNMAEANRLKTGILDAISEQIEDISAESLSIPIGSVLLPEVLSGHGPRLPVRILEVASSNATFSGHFIAAGINQTRHQIIITVSIEVIVVTPNGTLRVESSTNAIVAETVIVGQVPQTFVTF